MESSARVAAGTDAERRDAFNCADVMYAVGADVFVMPVFAMNRRNWKFPSKPVNGYAHAR